MHHRNARLTCTDAACSSLASSTTAGQPPTSSKNWAAPAPPATNDWPAGGPKAAPATPTAPAPPTGCPRKTTAEPRRLHCQVLHVAARITRRARQVHLRIHATWPWAFELATAFARLAALPRPVT
ncbi:hypothetical protein ACFQZ4_46475 [Catellatospora coxensis]